MEGSGFAVNQEMKKVLIYSTGYCPYCVRAKQLLEMKQAPYQEIRVDLDPAQREIMEKLSNRFTVPQIFIGERHVGGYDDLKSLNDRGELDAWLAD